MFLKSNRHLQQQQRWNRENISNQHRESESSSNCSSRSSSSSYGSCSSCRGFSYCLTQDRINCKSNQTNIPFGSRVVSLLRRHTTTTPSRAASSPKIPRCPCSSAQQRGAQLSERNWIDSHGLDKIRSKIFGSRSPGAQSIQHKATRYNQADASFMDYVESLRGSGFKTRPPTSSHSSLSTPIILSTKVSSRGGQLGSKVSLADRICGRSTSPQPYKMCYFNSSSRHHRKSTNSILEDSSIYQFKCEITRWVKRLQ